ncbi:MAG TPA: ATP-binding protein, partial [Acidimicrobiia bacterium]|nr:ATP-binding protein [Acidimicrobiia bacterium]
MSPAPHRMLLERERELAVLDDLIDGASEGRAAICVVEGPAGIGKTRLIAEARRRASERELSVLAASGNELEREFAFGVVAQLFEQAVADEPANLLRGATAPAAAILRSSPGPDPDDAASGPSFASLHGLYWLTIRLSEQRPLMLAIDDLQWCDAASLRFLAYLRPRLEGAPIVVVCGRRSLGPDQEEAADAAVLATVVDD